LSDNLSHVRIARFSHAGDVAFGLVEGDPGSEFISVIDGHPFTPFQTTGVQVPLADVRLLAPVIPTKVIAVGKNYADHAAEMGGEAPVEPLIFLKPSTAVVGHGDPIVYPKLSSNVHYEGELAVVIGKLCKGVPAERAHEVVFGYTCGNDVTARDLQKSDGQWSRAKGFDTFCPIGPWIATGIDAIDLAITTTLNGTQVQASRTSMFVHSIGRIIEYVSAVMTLLPGDVILTGTPAGVGPVQPGDEVSVTIEGIGTLTNRVIEQVVSRV
jgi:2-keto-4-pentenoate hydratase/2-oxohepta-3-ene-1,7-dioic acid hydratase in catechol pathway